MLSLTPTDILSIMGSNIKNLDWDFYSFFRKDYPEMDKTKPGSFRRTSGPRKYVCIHCGWESPYTTNSIRHAQSRHTQLVLESRGSSRPQLSTQASMDSFVDFRPADSALRNAFNEQRYTEAVVGLLTRRRMPFSAVVWDELKHLALACNPAIEDRLITTRQRAMRIIDSNYDLYVDQLKEQLQGSQSMIHISTDLWTSPHRHGVLAVCAQWVDKKHELRKALLGLPECTLSHSGEAQAALIMVVLRKLNISRVGYHTGDNATSNDTCLEVLSRMLRAEFGVDFKPKQRRIRCIGHIINLSLQSFLLARSKEALTAALEATSEAQSVDVVDCFASALSEFKASETGEPMRPAKRFKSAAKASQRAVTEEEYAGWQGIPALQKLHNLAVWLRSSSIHSDQWRGTVGLSLGIDNATRWSSWYHVIDNAIKKKNRIIQFLHEHDRELDDNRLNSSDWDLLTKTHAFLEPFSAATLYAEGKCSSIGQSLALMDALLCHYERAKTKFSQPLTRDPRMLRAIEMGWFVLNKYYTMTEDVPVYAAALLLDPSKRLKYIKQNWPQQWHETAIAGAQDIWMTKYHGLDTPRASDPPILSPKPSKKSGLLTDLLQLSEVSEDATDIHTDDLDAFINIKPFKIQCTPLEWWCRPEQRSQYPRLSRMAIDLLSIPSESAEPERAFSGARRTASWDRLKMTCQNLEKVECIGNWLREGLILPHGEGGLGLPRDVTPEKEDLVVDPALLDDSVSVDRDIGP
jgi:hypothetical protein